MNPRPVQIARDAFRFCRYSVAVLMWYGVLTHTIWPIAICAAVMAASAICTVRYAPLVLLYTLTVQRLYPVELETVDEGGMRFAHTVATVAMTVPLLLLALGLAGAAWKILFVVAIMKTVGALGFCPVSRGYACVVGKGGSCCRFLNREG